MGERGRAAPLRAVQDCSAATGVAVAWALATLILDFGCWLKQWEKALWRRGGLEPYPEGFLQYHILRYTFSPARARRNHVMLGVVVLMLNAGVYARIVRRGIAP